MLRILIADDEQPARVGMSRALRSSGCEILEAADGPAALDAIRTQAPDLVLLDLNMPGMNGQAVLRELGPAAQSAEIVIVTANDSIDAAVECMRLGSSKTRSNRCGRGSISGRPAVRWWASAARCRSCTG
jgi:CheY-like chemotaxis protein